MQNIKPIQEKLNARRSQMLNIIDSIRRTLVPGTGRAFYPRYEFHLNYPDGEKVRVWQGVQMVKMLPWRERILAFFSKRGKFFGKTFTWVGQTDDLAAVRMWVVGGDRSLLSTP